MTGISKGETTMEWICRALITIDLCFVIGGYISFFQTKRQLATPLIPHSFLYEVAETPMKAALITAIGLGAGLWFYFFRRRVIAIVLFGAAALSYQLILLFLNK
jgi:hypothetical protein